MPSWSYFFNPYPPALIPSSNRVALAALGAGVAVTIILWIVARVLKHDPPRRRFLMRLMQWCATAAFVVLLLYFFRVQRVYLLSAPGIAVVSLLGLAAWLIRMVIINVRRMSEDEKIRQAQETRKKYLS